MSKIIIPLLEGALYIGSVFFVAFAFFAAFGKNSGNDS